MDFDHPMTNSIHSLQTTPKIDHKKWDKRFLQMADLVSTWSKDPSTKIGTVIVNDRRRILSTGYNGFPRGIGDVQDRLNDREIKYKLIVHAEMNAIYNATWNGVSLDGCTVYTTGLPTCSDCAKGLLQIGAKRIVCGYPEDIPTNWEESFAFTKKMFNEAGIQTAVYHDWK